MNNQNKQPSEYFTKEIIEKMGKMSNKQMSQQLRELESTPYWIAILKYNQSRLGISQASIFTTDPVKEPTTIARNQGIMLGLSDLQNAIIGLIFQEQMQASEAEEANEDGTEVD